MDTFKNYPFLKNGWAQTITSSYMPTGKDVFPKDYHQICLGDGDQLMIAENTPQGWTDGDRITILVHGLSGNYQSFYMIRQTKYFMEQGHKVVRINLRGCGPGLAYARGIYHAGRSGDTFKVIEHLAKKYPHSPMTQIGFSLGGHITLKMIGEFADQLPETFSAGVAVSAPLWLADCSDHVHENRFFEIYFLTHMRFEVLQRTRQYPDINFPRIPLLAKSIRHFDNVFTAPVLGRKSAQDFYEWASCFPHLNKIKVPTLIVGAKNDPIADIFNYANIPNKENIHVKITESGGHVGFLGSEKNLKPSFWIDDYIHRWVVNQ